MQERAIHISSVDRQKIGKNKAEDFIIKFDPVLKLQNNMTHELVLDKVTMTYCWHNISDQYQKNRIKYSTGNSWETVKFIDGMYTTYNKGFALRKALLGASSTVNTEILLTRYSFFEMLEDELLPNTRVEINFEIESDGNLIWQARAACRVVITRMQLYVPRITFNSEGQSSYMSQYLKKSQVDLFERHY